MEIVREGGISFKYNIYGGVEEGIFLMLGFEVVAYDHSKGIDLNDTGQ